MIDYEATEKLLKALIPFNPKTMKQVFVHNTRGKDYYRMQPVNAQQPEQVKQRHSNNTGAPKKASYTTAISDMFQPTVYSEEHRKAVIDSVMNSATPEQAKLYKSTGICAGDKRAEEFLKTMKDQSLADDIGLNKLGLELIGRKRDESKWNADKLTYKSSSEPIVAEGHIKVRKDNSLISTADKIIISPTYDDFKIIGHTVSKVYEDKK